MTTEERGHEPATRLRFADHYDAELQRHGVLFDSRAWIVTARRAMK